MMEVFLRALQHYSLDGNSSRIEPLTSGLINHTLKVTCGRESWVLQKINESVFKNPLHLAENIQMIGAYLTEHHPEYLFIRPIKNRFGQELTNVSGEGCFRLLPFVNDSLTLQTVATANQAFESARQFGKFTNYLSGFNCNQLHITIPDFHNLTLRYNQFEQSISSGNRERITECTKESKQIKLNSFLVEEFEKIKQKRIIKIRVTHHDTKISNVLFDQNSRGICVIDLDTVMPGYFISDVGDMMRTYLSPVNEEERDVSKIGIRDDFFKAVVQGYRQEMQGELSEEEERLFVYAGIFMIYMQAIRFLTDYFNNDRYYGSNYEGHNLVRARNQLRLLEVLQENGKLLTGLIRR